MEDAKPVSTVKKGARGRVGRPRANPRPLEHPPEEEILLVAGRLFAQKGFAGTSTREIAEAAGLRQPSLFHYFPKKERILEALLERAGLWASRIVEMVEALPIPAAARLYRLVYDDVQGMCSAPYPIASILLLPEVQPPNFPEFWANHQKLLRLTQRLIEEGVQDGALSCDNAALAALALQGMTSGALAWYPRSPGLSPEETASQVANLELRTLLTDPKRLASIRSQALSLPVPTVRMTPVANSQEADQAVATTG